MKQSLTYVFSLSLLSSFFLFQIAEQREELSHDVRVCIGTPNRLLKLSQSGFLKWHRVRLIVWDIGKTRKLQIAEVQAKRRIKNKLKNGVHVEDPFNVEVRPDEKGQPTPYPNLSDRMQKTKEPGGRPPQTTNLLTDSD